MILYLCHRFDKFFFFYSNKIVLELFNYKISIFFMKNNNSSNHRSANSTNPETDSRSFEKKKILSTQTGTEKLNKIFLKKKKNFRRNSR